MSAPMTRGQLKQRAILRGDFLHTPYIDTSPGGELEQLVDTELRRLWNLLTDLDESYTEIGPFFLNTTQGQRQYMLPADFYKLTAVYYVGQNQPPNGYRKPLKQFMRHDYGMNAYASSWGQPPIYYRVDGRRNIIFDPVPQNSQTGIIEYWYCPVFNQPASDSELLTYFVIPGWEDYVVDGVVINLRIKEGAEDVSFLSQRRNEFVAGVRLLAANRDRFNPQRVQDVGWSESGGDSGVFSSYAYYGTW